MSDDREKIPVRRGDRRMKEVKQLAMIVDHAHLGVWDACSRCGRSRREHVA